jgi:hypothetical protein
LKAQFKYSFLAGASIRLPAYAVVFGIMLVFGVLGSLGLLPLAALITAVSLGGLGVGAVVVINIIGDIAIFRRMFSSPAAYLYALTPAPRWKILFSSLITAVAFTAVSLSAAIFGNIWLSLNLAGEFVGNIWEYMGIFGSENVLPILWSVLYVFAAYFLTLLIILFSITAAKSIFYKRAASGFFGFLLGCACFYVWSLSYLLLAPLGSVTVWGIFISIQFGSSAVFPLMLLTLLMAAGLFILTSKLMERKINL